MHIYEYTIDTNTYIVKEKKIEVKETFTSYVNQHNITEKRTVYPKSIEGKVVGVFEKNYKCFFREPSNIKAKELFLSAFTIKLEDSVNESKRLLALTGDLEIQIRMEKN